MGLNCKPSNELRSLFAKLENQNRKIHEQEIAQMQNKKQKNKK